MPRNRRIGFPGGWLDALVGAQARPEAVAAVDACLAAHLAAHPAAYPALPDDRRRTVLLQRADALRRTVAVRARYARANHPGESPGRIAREATSDRRGAARDHRPAARRVSRRRPQRR